MGARDSWALAGGESLTAELTAVRLLGGGSAYEAYLAFDEITYGPVVVKVLRPGRVDDPASRRGLCREADVLSRIHHPAVARALRAVPDGERPHLVLEAVDGPRLSTLLRRHGPLLEQQYRPLAVEVASALHYLGHRGLVHLDIKPSNLIMGAPARVIDLSVARTVEAAQRLDHPVGTDAYMAPEQCDPPRSGTPGPAADVFGLGVTLFESIVGHRPFGDGDPAAAGAADRCPQLVEAPRRLPSTVAPEVVEVVAACLARDPADRPLPREVADALAR